VASSRRPSLSKKSVSWIGLTLPAPKCILAPFAPNLFTYTDQLNMTGRGQVGVKSALFITSCNLSSLRCIFCACFGLPLRSSSCIACGQDSRALATVLCCPRCTTSCLTLPPSR
jgi:hypothetical protein